MEKALFQMPVFTKTEYINEKDELIQKAVNDINLLRVGTKFEKKIETAKSLAIRINQHPKLSRDIQELRYVLSECERKRNYSHLYFILPKQVKK